jgi:hypothetical protein
VRSTFSTTALATATFCHAQLMQTVIVLALVFLSPAPSVTLGAPVTCVASSRMLSGLATAGGLRDRGTSASQRSIRLARRPPQAASRLSVPDGPDSRATTAPHPVRALGFSVFDETETVSEWITAEGNRRTTWYLKQLLPSCTGTDCSL